MWPVTQKRAIWEVFNEIEIHIEQNSTAFHLKFDTKTSYLIQKIAELYIMKDNDPADQNDVRLNSNVMNDVNISRS